MSLQRKELEEMGISSENIEKIIAGHIDTVNSIKSELSTVKEQAANNSNTLKTEYDTKLNELNDKYSATTEELKSLKAELAEKAAKEIKDKTLRDTMKELKIEDKWFSKISKTIDIPTDESGNIDKEALSKVIKTEWGEIIPTISTQGIKNSTPKSSNYGMTREEIMKIKNTAERQKAIAENHDLFGF